MPNTSNPRIAKISRKTKETDIQVILNLDPDPTLVPTCNVSTGIGFLDHMLHALSRHGHLGLDLKCAGDLHIDQHHTVEDIGIALGQAFTNALGDHVGITRFGMMECPLDEALCKAVLDISGRSHLQYEIKFHRETIGTLDSSLVKEFFGGLVAHAKWTLHLDCIRGANDHHICEAMFKAVGRAIKQATCKTALQQVPSTKESIV
jgi:imidazoleglycerol-phosphate dehydratase